MSETLKALAAQAIDYKFACAQAYGEEFTCCMLARHEHLDRCRTMQLSDETFVEQKKPQE